MYKILIDTLWWQWALGSDQNWITSEKYFSISIDNGTSNYGEFTYTVVMCQSVMWWCFLRRFLYFSTALSHSCVDLKLLFFILASHSDQIKKKNIIFVPTLKQKGQLSITRGWRLSADLSSEWPPGIRYELSGITCHIFSRPGPARRGVIRDQRPGVTWKLNEFSMLIKPMGNRQYNVKFCAIIEVVLVGDGWLRKGRN